MCKPKEAQTEWLLVLAWGGLEGEQGRREIYFELALGDIFQSAETAGMTFYPSEGQLRRAAIPFHRETRGGLGSDAVAAMERERRPPNQNRDADAWMKTRKKGGIWRRGRKIYKRGERSGTSGSSHRKPLSEEQKAERALQRAAEKKLREKHAAWRCTFHKIQSAKTPSADFSNDVTFEDRVAFICALCKQSSEVASAALRVLPPTGIAKGTMQRRSCELFLVMNAKRAVGDMRKDFGASRIRLAQWEAASPKEWSSLGEDWEVVRDATPASKQDAQLLVAALTGASNEDLKPSRKRKVLTSSSRSSSSDQTDGAGSSTPPEEDPSAAEVGFAIRRAA